MEAVEVVRLDGIETLGEFHARVTSLRVHQSQRFLHLELDLINRCNLRCVMCYHSQDHAHRAPTVHMTPARFSEIAGRLLPRCGHLSLSLGNEPLMSPHFAEVLAVAARYAVPCINFFTNGLLLDDVRIDAILAHGVTQVCISIDGATAGTYNGVRRGGNFDLLMARVGRLVQRRHAAGLTRPVVRFDWVMMQRNVHELPDLVRLAKSLGVDELCLQHLIAFEGLDMERESLRHTKALSNYWLDRALALASALGVRVAHHPAPFNLEPPEVQTSKGTPGPFVATPYCAFPFFHVTMSPDGSVLPCPYSHGEGPWGRVSTEMPPDRIWLGPRFTELRRRILAHDPPAMCLRCPSLANRHPDVAALFATRHN